MSFFKSVGRFLFGHKPKEKQIPRYTEAQQQALNTLLQQGLSEADVTKLEKRLKDIYTTETVPMLAEKFSSMGSQGSQRSSGFEQALSRGAQDLSSQLAALHTQAGMHKLQMGLTPQYDTVIEAGRPGLMQELAPALMGAALGGPAMGMGMGLSNIFGQKRQKSAALGGGRFAPGQPIGGEQQYNPAALMRILQSGWY